MYHTSVIELSRSALQKNLRFLKRRIGRSVRFTSVVKGNAYGHGLPVFVRLAEDCGVRSFAVFSADEALEVLSARTRGSDILIMGAVDHGQLEWAVENDIGFYVFDFERLAGAIGAAQQVKRKARIHLELETGMHRLGFEPPTFEQLAKVVKDHADELTVEGCCTHYAGAESISNHVRVQGQIAAYGDGLERLAGLGVEPRYRHTACSAALLVYPQTIMDMVRVGIAQYGYWPSQEVQMRTALEKQAQGIQRWHDPLKRVISWKSRVMTVKKVKPGDFIGYGTSYLANTPKTIAIVPVGYSSGFTRRLSNMGRVLIRGRRFGVVGLVNMSMMAVDISEVPSISPGDEVVLIGRQQKREISVASFSEMSQFLNYEMLVRLPREIPRKVID